MATLSRLALVLLGPVAASFTPFLQSRQSSDTCTDLGWQECGSSATCIPLDYKCCPDNAGGCPADGYDCWLGSNNEYGCCPVGEECSGPGGVDQIGISSTLADVATSAIFDDATSSGKQAGPTTKRTSASTTSLDEDLPLSTDLSDATTTSTSRRRTTFQTEATPTFASETTDDTLPTPTKAAAGGDDEDAADVTRASWAILGVALAGVGALLL